MERRWILSTWFPTPITMPCRYSPRKTTSTISIGLILKEVIELLEKYPDYKFTIEQTFLLEEVELKYPELFSKIKEYIKQGRLEIADGEYLMADTTVPQGETG